jgi:hypothetical protein
VTSTTDSDSFALSSKNADAENTNASSSTRPYRFGCVATSMYNVTSKLTSIRSKSNEAVSNTWITPVDNAPTVDPNAHQEQAYGNVNFKITYDQYTKK